MRIEGYIVGKKDVRGCGGGNRGNVYEYNHSVLSLCIELWKFQSMEKYICR